MLFDYVIRADPERNHERAVERGELSDTRAHVHRDLDPFVATLIAAGRAA